MPSKPPPPPPTHLRPAPTRPDLHWRGVLAAVGYPLDVLVLDFETYFDSEYGLKTYTVPEYIASPKFEVMGLAHLRCDGQNPHIDPDQRSRFETGEDETAGYLHYLQLTYGDDLAGVTVTCQNAKFDAMVLAMKYNLHPRYIIDTSCLASAYHTRSKHGLKDLCTKFGLKAKGETKDFMGVTLRRGRYVASKGRGKQRLKPPIPRPLATDEQLKALAEYACNDVARQFELFAILLPKLSNPATELRIADATLRMVTQPLVECDNARGHDLIEKMIRRMGEACTSVGSDPEDIGGNISFDRLLTEALEAAGDRPGMYQKAMKKGWAYELAKDDPGLKRLQNHASPRVRQLVAARSALKSWPLHIARIERIMRMACASGGKMPVPLTFHGAHTGRDTGSWQVNLQNLPKRGEPEVVAVRGLLVAPEGSEFVIVDLAAIEARVLAWFAGEWQLVDAFKAGADVYCQFGTTFYGVPVRKARKDDLPPIAKLMTERRGFSKICILGMGYGMGVDKFSDYAACDQATAERAVKVYREKYQDITRFWRAIEKAFLYTAKYKRPCGLERGVSFHSTDDVDVVMTLPNGRRMNYHKVKLEAREYSESPAVYNEMEHCWNHLWGGVLTENLVQAVSRDVMMEAMLRLNDMGHRTVHRVHDELILCVERGKGEEVLKLAEAELSREPVWGPRMPLGAEGVVAERYGLH